MNKDVHYNIVSNGVKKSQRKQQGYIVQHSRIQTLFYNNFKSRIIYKYIESLCCTPKTNIIL